MPDIDKLLEAEKTINDIATELGRMKSAADLMDSAQTKIDAVVTTSSDIITKTGEFVKEGTQIVERIGDYDIQGDLSKIHDTTDNIKDEVQKLSQTLTETKKSIGDLKKDILNSLSQTHERNEQYGKIIIGLASGNILLGIIILLKTFQLL